MLPTKSLIIAVIVSLGMPLILLASSATTTQLQPPKLISNAQKTIVAIQPKRIALVIGNTHYPGHELSNPVNDANDMTRALGKLGFEVIEVLDANKKDMDTALTNFQQKLCQGCVGLFYYSGHGLSVNGENYLIPIDAHLNSQNDVNYETLPVQKVQNAMEEAQTDVNIIILDACRDNPFSKKWHRGVAVQGLSPITKTVKGSLIAFATKYYNIAADGTGRNGTFTSYLLQYISIQNLPVEELFKRVRIGVAQETNNAQIPEENSTLVGDFYFNPTNTTANPVPVEKPIPAQYVKLRDLLAAQNWKDADSETNNVMLQVAGKTSQGWLDLDDIKKFPCSDLNTIDSLWKQYSNGRFGFSVQKQIWLEVGGKIDYDTDKKIGDRVGWYVNNRWINYDEIKFNLSAPPGHLPSFFLWSLGDLVVWGTSSLASRVATCSL